MLGHLPDGAIPVRPTSIFKTAMSRTSAEAEDVWLLKRNRGSFVDRLFACIALRLKAATGRPSLRLDMLPTRRQGRSEVLRRRCRSACRSAGSTGVSDPGTPLLDHITNLSVKDGGATFRPAFFRIERLGDASRRDDAKGQPCWQTVPISSISESRSVYPEFTLAMPE